MSWKLILIDEMHLFILSKVLACATTVFQEAPENIKKISS